MRSAVNTTHCETPGPRRRGALAALALVAMTASVASTSAAQDRTGVPQPILIRNATVLTISNGTLAATDILLQDGRIARIGTELAAPAGAKVIDATGKFVMPGIIDAHSHMMSDAINESTLSVTSMTRISDVLNPTAVNVYRALAGGVTSANLLHGSANTIGGQSATVKLKYGTSADEMLFDGAPPGIKFALGENVTRKNRTTLPGSVARYPSTRMGQEEVLRDAFTRAREYQRDWADHRTRARSDRNAVAPRRDLELEPLVEILEGTRLVHAHSYRADEIHMLLQLADEFGFKVKTLQHVLEGYKVAPEIARHGAGASTFADNWSYKIEAYDAIPHAAAIMTRAGIITSINSDSDERIRRLNIDAAKMMRYGGLTELEALKLITWNAAWQLGVEDRVGSIEVGKDADVAIWNAHPLSVYSSAETTIIDGVIYFDKQLDREQREQREQERRALVAAARPAQAGPVLPNEENQR